MDRYYIAIGGNAQELEEEVNKKMEEGYVPIGGVCRGDSYPLWSQAMLKKNELQVLKG